MPGASSASHSRNKGPHQPGAQASDWRCDMQRQLNIMTSSPRLRHMPSYGLFVNKNNNIQFTCGGIKEIIANILITVIHIKILDSKGGPT